MPSYKSHSRWIEAIRLTEAAYGAAARLRARIPEAARGLRKAAVVVPASVAEMLEAEEPDARSEALARALEALAALRQRVEEASDLLAPDEAQLLRRLAADLSGVLLFEFGRSGPDRAPK